MIDKYRERLLNDKLKRYYDVLLNQSLSYIPKEKINTFKNQLSKNLNGAYRLGVSENQILP